MISIKASREQYDLSRAKKAALAAARERFSQADRPPEDNTAPDGYLGEIILNNWFARYYLTNSIFWTWENPFRNPDFIFRFPGLRITLDVKTTTRSAKMKPTYRLNANEDQLRAMVTDYLFFNSYNQKTRIMTLVGGISRREFNRVAIPHKEGDTIPNENQDKEGKKNICRADMRSILGSQLIPPFDFFSRYIGLTRLLKGEQFIFPGL